MIHCNRCRRQRCGRIRRHAGLTQFFDRSMCNLGHPTVLFAHYGRAYIRIPWIGALRNDTMAHGHHLLAGVLFLALAGPAASLLPNPSCGVGPTGYVTSVGADSSLGRRMDGNHARSLPTCIRRKTCTLAPSNLAGGAENWIGNVATQYYGRQRLKILCGRGRATTPGRAPDDGPYHEQIAGKRPAIHFTICPQAIEMECPHSGIFYS
jgi:hypothetical protein